MVPPIHARTSPPGVRDLCTIPLLLLLPALVRDPCPRLARMGRGPRRGGPRRRTSEPTTFVRRFVSSCAGTATGWCSAATRTPRGRFLQHEMSLEYSMTRDVASAAWGIVQRRAFNVRARRQGWAYMQGALRSGTQVNRLVLERSHVIHASSLTLAPQKCTTHDYHRRGNKLCEVSRWAVALDAPDHPQQNTMP